jgi:ADP-heptose:LPS heptosyltransferase
MVLPNKGLFNEYIDYSANKNRTGSALLMISLLRRAKYDTLAYLYPQGRSRWQVWRDIMFFHFAGINSFIGTHGLEILARSSFEGPLPTVQHESDHLLQCLALSGIPIPSPGCGNMDLGITEAETTEVDDWLKMYVHLDKMGLLVGVGPGSKMPAKVWPEERFLAVGHFLIKEFGMVPIVFGGKEERALGDRLITAWGNGVNAAGELNVRQAAAALARCQLYVGNDTGTMHLAAAVNTPCIGIFSAHNWPGKWYPYGNSHIVLRESVPCEGCILKVCNRNMECLKKISVESVFSACQHVLCSRKILRK